MENSPAAAEASRDSEKPSKLFIEDQESAKATAAVNIIGDCPGNPIILAKLEKSVRLTIEVLTDRTAQLLTRFTADDSNFEIDTSSCDVYAVVCSKDGSTFIACFHSPSSGQQVARIWSIQSDYSFLHVVDLSLGKSGFAPYLSCDGSRLYGVDTENVNLTCWDIRTATPLWSRPLAYASSLPTTPLLRGSQDGSLLAARCNSSTTIEVLSAQSGVACGQLNASAVSSSIDSLRFTCHSINPTATAIATGFSDNCVRIWDIASGSVSSELDFTLDTLLDVCYSPDGMRLAAVLLDNTAIVWDLESSARLSIFEMNGDRTNSRQISFSNDSSRLVSFWHHTYYNGYHVWDTTSGMLLISSATRCKSILLTQYIGVIEPDYLLK